jgi:hypothetical protein
MIRALEVSSRDNHAMVAAPIGATMHASSHFQAPDAPLASRSPAASRNAKRRSFQRRLAAAFIATIVVAGMLAAYRSGDRTPAGHGDVTDASQTTATTTAGTAELVKPPMQHNETAGTTVVSTAEPIHPNTIAKPERPKTVTEPPPSPPPSPNIISASAPLPERPRIAVIGTGDDPLLAGALEQEMERRLDQFDVADEHGDPEVSELLRRDGSNVAFKELGATLLKSGFQILVVLTVQKAESRTTSIHGITGTVRASQMRLNAYLLPASRPIGRGWTE